MPIIVAHRGLHFEYPENSVGAFRAAWGAGIEWCECDVQESADGELIVIHDPTLERTTDACGRVSDFPVDALKRVRLRTAVGEVTDERIGTLKELLDAMPAEAGLLLEIKPVVPRGSLWSSLEMLEGRRVTVQSFHRSVVIEAAKVVSRAEFLTSEAEDLADPSALPGSGVNARHDLLTREVVERVRKAGKRVGAWTVNAEPDIRRIAALRVDMIISDDPLRVRDILQ
jgi:glycerophosphoryl diester phosphodiesterase